METSTKNEIRECLASYIARFKSQNVAVNSLTDISGSYISQIMNGKFSAISAEKWHLLAAQIGYVKKIGMVYTETTISKLIMQSLELAKKKEVINITGVLARGGSGKTITAEKFVREYPEAIYVLCKRTLSLKNFLKSALRSIGVNTQIEGLTTENLSTLLTDSVRKMDNPIFIIDEINKASDNILLELVDIYNALKYKCPIVTLGTPEYKKRIERGLDKKTGYDELYSRYNRQFKELPLPSYHDVAKVCIANGITDEKTVSELAKKSFCDLRAVEDHLQITKLKISKAA